MMHKQLNHRQPKVLRLKRYTVLICICIVSFGFIPAGLAQTNLTLKSPDEKVVVKFDLKTIGEKPNCPVYSVSYRNLPVVVDSSLGFALKGAASLEAGFEIAGVTKSSRDTVWHPVYGERKVIRDHYNQLIVDLKESAGSNRQLRLTFRVYNEGMAFCYTLPRQSALKDFVISAEKTQFRFLADHTAWAVYSAQGRYSKVPLSKVKNNCERPTTIQIDDNIFVAVGEAGLVDYARMRLSPAKDRPNTLVSSLASEVEATTPYTTPWRAIILGDTPGNLLERNYLILNLNEPCAIKDTSWIKPGKVIREVTLTTNGGKACVDFAVEHNLQYVEFDAGWYGPEGSGQSDARTISLDPGRSKGPLDLHHVIDYAKKRGIGIILYVNRRALERQLDEILPLYEKWGVKGVKYGFVQVGSRKWTRWLHEAVRKAAKYHLMVDIHDEYRPTGYSRTYPNLMTQEGIAGDETSPANSLTLTILFTRMLAGPADNTICYYDQRVDRNASHAYQLAKAVCFYSPWQFLYWYDRPQASPQKTGGAGGAETGIGSEPELEFFDHCPTVWDDTKVIHGSIGEYAVMARRSGDNWFIGCMNSGQPRTFNVPLEFLDTGSKYIAHVYSDDPAVPTRTHVRIERFVVDRDTVLKMDVSAKGGQALRIVPASIDDLEKFHRYKP
ncbi:MAG: glycoside hydrolase family 97 N-terminal domain-containing protein [Sedimentisphaerales bacterium]